MEKLAILCSDLHLSHTPPIARSGEPDWYEAMRRPLRELRDLQDSDPIPIICGGDVFDRWASKPRLINFAMQELPEYFASVMGQHDLPYHSWEERESSAFWTLVEADRLVLLDGWRGESTFRVRGFRWGQKLRAAEEGLHPCTEADMEMIVAHCYCWWEEHGVDAIATEQNCLSSYFEKLRGYRVALFGDNHKGFLESRGKCSIFNAGTFMRRCVDERDYRPMVGVLHEDGTVKPHYLDTSKDVLDASDAAGEAEQVVLELDSFLEELRGLGEGGLDFRKAVEAALNREQVSKAVRRVILDAMEGE